MEFYLVFAAQLEDVFSLCLCGNKPNDQAHIGHPIDTMPMCCPLTTKLDGCQLKGTYEKQLLDVVGKDQNDNYFGIIVTDVEVETKD
ncbi:hypothetical protein CR513_27618, partial [Mucuna pruriens]